MMRYSTPWCAPLLNLGEDCRPTSSNEPSITNRTLAYPGGLEIFLKDAYQVLKFHSIFSLNHKPTNFSFSLKMPKDSLSV